MSLMKCNHPRIRFFPSAVVVGLLFAFSLVTGQSFAETGDFSQMLGGVSRVAVSLAKLLLYAVATSLLLSVLFSWFDGWDAPKPRPQTHRAGRTRAAHLRVFADRHVFGLALALLAACWGTYIAVFAPGTLTYDGARSLNQFCAGAPLENHHPVLMNLLYGLLMHAGRAMGSDDWGVFLIVALQAAALVCALSAVLSESRRRGLPLAVTALAALYFALFPAWGVLAQDALKDTLFCAVFTWFMLRLARVAAPPEDSAPIGVRDWALLAAAGSLVALTRNNGIYLVAPTLLALAITPCAPFGGGRSPVEAGSSLAAVVATYVALTSFVYPACGVDMSEEKEMLSVPFQQTARIVGEHGDDVSEAERAAIDAVLPYDQLAELYDPDLSDPVKESYKLHNSKVESSFEYANEHPEALGDYLRVWLGLALRHPACALTATAANTYAYFYPGEVVDVDGTRPVLLVGWQTDGDIAAAYDVSYLMPANAVARASAAVQATLEVPGMRYLYSPGLYVWLLVAIVAYLIHARRWGTLVVCVPPVMLMLTVLAGPLNGHLRYVMPMIAVLPLLWSFAFHGIIVREPRSQRASGQRCPLACNSEVFMKDEAFDVAL